MPKQTVRDLDVAGRKVLVRVDFNVPQAADLSISDDRRIRGALPTLKAILEKEGSLLLVSHLGRPTGDPATDEPFRLDPIAVRLQELLGRPVVKVNDTVGPEASLASERLERGGVVLLENVRFNKGEKKGEVEFAKKLAGLADCYVNDAFGTCHRDEASMLAVAEQFAPERRAIGFLVEKELSILDTLLKNPQHPYVAVMGGSKVSDKIGVIESLIKRVDKLLVGGAMTYTFLKAKGIPVGKSRFEADKLDLATQVLDLAGDKLVLPLDHLVADKPATGAATKVVGAAEIPDGWFGMDIGPETIALYSKIINEAGTVIWNGPMGMFEVEEFSKGTRAVAAAMAAASGVTAVGGGESAEAVEKFGFAEQVTHVSTGGGAFLEALEGKVFNSLKVIPEKS
jgi:phosphoglycerate kinase